MRKWKKLKQTLTDWPQEMWMKMFKIVIIEFILFKYWTEK